MSLGLFLAGCQHTEQGTKNDGGNYVQENRHGEIHESVSEFSALDVTHKVNFDTPYYSEGPQQGRAPDGTLVIGTKVKLVEASGEYAFVVSETGVKGYVLASDLETVQP